MEWGEQMAAALADERLEIHIDRPNNTSTTDSDEPSADGERIVTITPVGARYEHYNLNEPHNA